jgi:hypothetical protein
LSEPFLEPLKHQLIDELVEFFEKRYPISGRQIDLSTQFATQRGDSGKDDRQVARLVRPEFTLDR